MGLKLLLIARPESSDPMGLEMEPLLARLGCRLEELPVKLVLALTTEANPCRSPGSQLLEQRLAAHRLASAAVVVSLAGPHRAGQ